MTHKYTVQDLIDLLTDENQITVEQRSLPLVMNNESSATITELYVPRITNIGFTKAGQCLMQDRARRPDKLGEVALAFCLCTRASDQPMPGNADADADADTTNRPG